MANLELVCLGIEAQLINYAIERFEIDKICKFLKLKPLQMGLHLENQRYGSSAYTIKTTINPAA